MTMQEITAYYERYGGNEFQYQMRNVAVDWILSMKASSTGRDLGGGRTLRALRRHAKQVVKRDRNAAGNCIPPKIFNALQVGIY